MRIAVHDGASAPADKDANLAQLEATAARARAAGAELLVLPQLFLTGPCNTRTAALELAEASDGPAAHAVAAAARQHGLAILCGYVELCTRRPWDATLLVDRRGCAVLNYRRTHLHADTDAAAFAVGQWLSATPLGGGKVGLLIGADIEVPEPMRALALVGVGLVLLPALHGGALAGMVPALLATRAYENDCAVAYANGHPDPQAPRSRIVGPDGSVLAQAAGPGELAVATVPEAAARPERLRLGRHPRLYQRLALMAEEDGERL